MSGRFDYLKVVSFCDKGLLRDNNEDSFLILDSDGVFAVADGMGGGDAGELASQWVCEELDDVLQGTCGESPGLRKYEVSSVVERVNARIREYAAKRGYSMMGTTLALMLFDPWDATKARICHIGDSRIYLIRNNELCRLTRDHTVGEELIRNGADIDLSSGKVMRLAHTLTRSIGTADKMQLEWSETSVEGNDRFLICSDGVTSMLSDEDMSRIIVNSDESSEKICQQLMYEVRSSGAMDNFTMILISIGGSLPPSENPTNDEILESNYLAEKNI
jgi:protein phosphatase